MDSVSAANAASTTVRAASTTPATGTSKTAKTADGKDFATLFADAKRDLRKGETLSKVDGHEYGRIKGGTRDDQCVNLSGNARTGQAFDLIWRDGRQFHVYGGRGADHKVVEVGHKAATRTGGTDTTSSAGTTASRTTGTTPAATTDASASTGSTSTTSPSTTGSNASDVTSSYTGTSGTSDTSSSAR